MVTQQELGLEIAEGERPDRPVRRMLRGIRHGIERRPVLRRTYRVLVVRGADAPTPRRNTDSDFGGFPASHRLVEGERITVGTVSCEPVGDGVRCEDASSGHGFALSVAAIDAW